MSSEVRHYLMMHNADYYVTACGQMTTTYPEHVTLFKKQVTP